MLARSQKPITLKHLVEQMHFLSCPFGTIGLNPDHFARMHFVNMPNMGFGGEVTAARGDIDGITANNLHKTVCGVAKGL